MRVSGTGRLERPRDVATATGELVNARVFLRRLYFFSVDAFFILFHVHIHK